MTACTRSDCSGGVLDDDGVCDACFRGPETGAAVTSGITIAATTAAGGVGCQRPDCDGGTLDEDGICDVCFRAAPVRFTPPPEPGAPETPPIWTRVPWEADGSSEPGPAFVAPTGAASRALARSKLGVGVIDVAPVRPRTPAEKTLADPVVDERDRRCPNSACQADVGRVGGRPGPVDGSCPNCGTEFSFRPALSPGDDLSPQYQIDGCIGYGGQGWVYLAHDRNLDNEPVAVKGLRGAKDKRTANMLATEKRTLIQVRHPDIVDIRNFVSRPRGAAGDDFDVYIVLEFLPGVSLAEKAADAGGVLPVGEAIAYVLAALPALGYLHGSGLVYGDFKPPNVMQVGDRVKLLDMGAVTYIGAPEQGYSWATRGFVAPEVASSGPSVASDLYSVGRTLATLTATFDLGDRYRSSLPEPRELAVLARYESFYRFLRRATATDPRRRFTSAAQMAEQLTGVLREVVAFDAGPDDPRPPAAPSVFFTPERGVLGADLASRLDPALAALALPLPRPDEADPAAGFLATVTATEPQDVVRELAAAPTMTPEVAFRLVLAHIALGAGADARKALEHVDGRDWRRTWYRGLIDLAGGDGEGAWRDFAALRDTLPGEPAPKLALAVCAESLDSFELARHYYSTVWRTDDTYVGAAFGVARTYLLDPAAAGGDQAVSVLEAIPERHHQYVAARLEALRLRLERRGLDAGGLREAARRLRALRLDAADTQHLRLRIRLFEAARRLLADGAGLGGEPLLGVAPDDDAFGRELERCYLALRRPGRDARRARVELVRSAHAARPWTRW